MTYELAPARAAAHWVAFTDGGAIIGPGPAAQVLGAPSEKRTRAFLSAVIT